MDRLPLQRAIFATPVSELASKADNRNGASTWLAYCVSQFSPMKSIDDAMKRITIMSALLVLLGGVVAAHAQGGYGLGVNPSNSQDLTFRSNSQDLTMPGAVNRQDLVRRPTGVTSVVTSPTGMTTRRYKTKSTHKRNSSRAHSQDHHAM